MKSRKPQRKSSKREKILEIFKKEHILTARDIINKIPSIDKATVYRNIKLFLAKGLIKELKNKDGFVTYEYVRNDHHHLVCKLCKRVFSFEVSLELVKRLLPKNTFDADSYELSVSGTCSDCSKK